MNLTLAKKHVLVMSLASKLLEFLQWRFSKTLLISGKLSTTVMSLYQLGHLINTGYIVQFMFIVFITLFTTSFSDKLSRGFGVHGGWR